jgi:serine/threonine protein phosphatase PrpC
MIRTNLSPLHVAAVTHPGSTGKVNEDRFAVSSFKLSEKNPIPSVFAIVSDGIGGHCAGEVAAEMAVESICHMVARSDGRYPLEILDQSIRLTSDAIAARAKDSTQRLGMGTTCACAWVIGDQLFTASVGDSRIYLLRNADLAQLTIDHTWVQEAVDRGILDPQEIRSHPNVHVIRRYLGSPKTPRADTRLRLAADETDTQSRSNQGLRLLPGDMILLCTDGLTDVVEAGEIAPIVRGLSIQAGAQALLDLALERDGRDNITVVMLSVPWGNKQPRKLLDKFWQWAVLGLLVLILAALLISSLAWIIIRMLVPPGL